ncbi:MAG: tRNA (guanosine(46)-N7)-methyltransferase TrmB [Legionellales bacterium]|nr:tRNA (guanosine(46)-N7)-methyltransferase TrmB [Legionellales bacterium]
MVIHKEVKSYVIRASKLTKNQNKALQDYSEKFCIDYGSQRLADIFTNNNNIVCDIGFGMASNLIDQALLHDDFNYLGIEVYPPGVGSALASIARNGCENIKIIEHDAIEVLNNMIADDSFIKVQLLYPDPWPKKRHHKRRIVSPSFLNLVARVLKSGGVFQVITDWDPYAEHIKALLVTDLRFVIASEADFAPTLMSWPNPIGTAYAKKGINKGHTISNLIYKLS